MSSETDTTIWTHTVDIDEDIASDEAAMNKALEDAVEAFVASAAANGYVHDRDAGLDAVVTDSRYTDTGRTLRLSVFAEVARADGADR